MTRLDLSLLSGLLGGLLVVYAVLNLGGIRFTISAHKEIWAGPIFGTANGILTGMTGSFVVPGVMYLQAIGLSRDSLVQAMGMLFASSTVALAFALQVNNLFPMQLSVVSAAAVFPTVVGMLIGQRVRRAFSEDRFRRVFFIALLALGVYIIAKTTLGA